MVQPSPELFELLVFIAGASLALAGVLALLAAIF